MDRTHGRVVYGVVGTTAVPCRYAESGVMFTAYVMTVWRNCIAPDSMGNIGHLV